VNYHDRPFVTPNPNCDLSIPFYSVGPAEEIPAMLKMTLPIGPPVHREVFQGLRRSMLEPRGESMLGLTEELELRRLRSLCSFGWEGCNPD
jgi:hypothetical protein